MEMFERIKILRKDYLHLTQTEFGERLGVSRSVINNIERNALARPEQKASLIKLMCSEFNVSEQWLREGVGEMFVQSPSGIMQQLASEYDLDEFSASLVQEYLKLNPDQRKAVRDFFYRVVKTDDKQAEIDKEVESYRRDLELEARQAEESPVSDCTEEGKKKNA